MTHLGDYHAGSVVEFKWNSQGSDGASITRETDGALRIYKDNSTTYRASASGVTDTEDFGGVVGVHHTRIDLNDNADAGFYAAQSEYQVVLEGAVIDGKTVNAVLAQFSIERTNGAIALAKQIAAAITTLTANVSDVPTNSELTTALGGTEDAVLAALASVQSHGDSAWATATGFSTLDAAGIRAAVGLADANLDSQLADLPTNAELAAALDGLDDATLAAIASLQAHGDAGWATATGFSTLDAAGVRAAIGLGDANLDSQLGDLPTNAELTTALAGADDAVLAAIAALQAHGDSAWVTASGFSTLTPADVWSHSTRELTSGANIVLAKGTGITGLNDPSTADISAALFTQDSGQTAGSAVAGSVVSEIVTNSGSGGGGLDAAGVRDAIGLATNNLDSQLSELRDDIAAVQAHGDTAWITATGFSTLDAAGVRAAVGLATGNLDAQLDALPTLGEVSALFDSADDGTLAAVAALQAHGDTAWATAAGFSTLTAEGVWSAASRTLTSAENITSTGGAVVLHTDNRALLAGTVHTGAVVPTVTDVSNLHPAAATAAAQATLIAGLITPAGVRSALGLTTANLDAQLAPLANLPAGIKRNTPFPGFEFEMVSATDHVSEATGLEVSAVRSIDGGNYDPCDNPVAEVGRGTYVIDFTAADLNGVFITYKFSAPGADTRTVSIKTNP